MKIKLQDILESTILSEGRKEDTMKKFNAPKEVVDKLSAGDPSGNNKYLLWMTKQAMESGGEDFIINVIIDAVERYHQQVNRLNKEIASNAGVSDKVQKNPKDINVYRDVNELLMITKKAEEITTDKQIKKEADKIYEDENILVVSPLTVRASCKYGAGSRWCVAGGSAPSYNPHFDNYTRNNVFYFITDKNSTQRDNPDHYKYALQYGHDGGKTWWDASDSSHSDSPSFMKTPSGDKAMAAINAYHRSAVGDKLKREIQKYLLQPTSTEYQKFVEHLDQSQKAEVIKKIIREEGYTIQVLESLINDLTEAQKDTILHNLTNLNYSGFNNVKERLNDTQLINVLINNPSVLNNSEAINYVDNKLNEKQKFELANKIDKKMVNNTDSTVILRGWSMSDEQKKTLNKTSFYIMLVGPDGVTEVVKVDPTKPESYRVINGLKLKATIDQSLTVYAIKTEQGLLDDYLDTQMPKDVEAKIMVKAQKVKT